MLSGESKVVIVMVVVVVVVVVVDFDVIIFSNLYVNIFCMVSYSYLTL